jgi:branched-chain amino acid transport system permease protein
MITILGGRGTFLGPLIGAAVFLFLQNTISLWTPRWELFVGSIFVGIILLFPGGIIGTIQMVLINRKVARMQKQDAALPSGR